MFFFCTCHRVELALTQDDGEHEDELGGALGKGLDDPQHAEVVGQVYGETLTVVVTVPEAPQRELHHTGMSGEKSRETLHGLIRNKRKITIQSIKDPVHNVIIEQ